MRSEIRALQQRLGITTIYVTHDQQEALAISDQVAVMSGGRVIEIGAPGELYEKPKARFTAEFIGTANMLAIDGALLRVEAGGWQANCTFGSVRLHNCDPQNANGSGLLLMIRPEHVEVSASPMTDSGNAWPARVQSVTFLGNFTECLLVLGGYQVLAQIAGMAALTVGQDVFLRLPPEKCAIVRGEDGATALARNQGTESASFAA
jgi:iron(III) transport system ATP-binding protein